MKTVYSLDSFIYFHRIKHDCMLTVVSLYKIHSFEIKNRELDLRWNKHTKLKVNDFIFIPIYFQRWFVYPSE